MFPNRRPLTVVSMLVVAVLATLIGTTSAPAPVAAAPRPTPFSDVEDGRFYTAAVAWLVDAGITTGTSPTTYSPDDPVTRGQMAAFLERYAQVDGVAGAHGFRDVPAGAYYDGSVSFLSDRGITTGTAPSTYAPNEVVTRAQMATFLWRFSLEPTTATPLPFTDVASGTYYHDAVRWLAAEGITTGVTPTRFDPRGAVSRGQMATFLWRLADEPAVGELGTNRVDLETTIVTEAADLTPASTVDGAGTSVLVYATDDVPDVGDVVVMGVSELTPTGFLGSVTSVSGSRVTTEPARLQDAIAAVDLASSFDVEEGMPLASSSLTPQAGGGGAFENVDASCSTGGSTFEVEVDFDLTAGLDLEASWDPFNGVEAYVGFNAGVDVDVNAVARGAVECSATLSVPGPRLQPITFWLGPLPVVLQPELSLEIEVGGSLEAELTAGVFYTYDVSAGVRYRNGGWSTEYRTNQDSGVRLPTIAATATAGVELRGRLDVKAYGIGGPYVTLGPFIDLTVENTVPWWKVDAGLRASIGAAIDVFFFEDDVQFAEVDLLRFRLADSDNWDPTRTGELPMPPPGGLDFLQALPLESVDSYWNTSCGTDAVGQVHCWGANDDGQIGDGTFVDRSTGTKVVGISDARAVAVGERHACALRDNGTVMCWGANDRGQLGRGSASSTDSPTPAAVPGLTSVISIDAGEDTTCAVLADYTLRCWGANDFGQLGVGDLADRASPVVVALDTVSDTALGAQFSCATQATGRVWCWGRNDDGRLGVGSTTDRSVPAEVRLSSPGVVGSVGAGLHHACAMKLAGTVECWGRNFEGQLGDGSLNDRLTPGPVSDITSATALTVGRYHSCIEMLGGGARCWGSDVHGQLGDAAAPFSLRPTTVDLSNLAGTDIGSLAAGSVHTCAVLATNRATCWGGNFEAQLGDDTLVSARPFPSSVVKP